MLLNLSPSMLQEGKGRGADPTAGAAAAVLQRVGARDGHGGEGEGEPEERARVAAVMDANARTLRSWKSHLHGQSSHQDDDHDDFLYSFALLTASQSRNNVQLTNLCFEVRSLLPACRIAARET